MPRNHCAATQLRFPCQFLSDRGDVARPPVARELLTPVWRAGPESSSSALVKLTVGGLAAGLAAGLPEGAPAYVLQRTQDQRCGDRSREAAASCACFVCVSAASVLNTARLSCCHERGSCICSAIRDEDWACKSRPTQPFVSVSSRFLCLSLLAPVTQCLRPRQYTKAVAIPWFCVCVLACPSSLLSTTLDSTT